MLLMGWRKPGYLGISWDIPIRLTMFHEIFLSETTKHLQPTPTIGQNHKNGELVPHFEPFPAPGNDLLQVRLSPSGAR